MKKSILIAGGTGFIGQNLAKRCIKSKLNVTVLSSSKKKLLSKNIKFIRCNISKKRELLKKLKKKKKPQPVNFLRQKIS